MNQAAKPVSQSAVILHFPGPAAVSPRRPRRNSRLPPGVADIWVIRTDRWILAEKERRDREAVVAEQFIRALRVLLDRDRSR